MAKTHNPTQRQHAPLIAIAAFAALSFSHATAKNESSDTPIVQAPHINAISSSPIDQLMAPYAEDAHLEWIGGPLDGAYQGAPAIKSAWTKFIAARGDMHVEIKSREIAKNPKGYTVLATVLFHGKKTIPVRLITTYRDNEITSEIWQIDPAMMN